jgi:hypothetical protein
MILLQHHSRDGLGAQETAEKFDVEYAAHLLFRQVNDRHPVRASPDSRIVDQDIHLAELVDGLPDHISHLLPVGDIDYQRKSATSQFTDFLRDGCDVIPPQRSFIRRERGRFTPRAGHNYIASFESEC